MINVFLSPEIDMFFSEIGKHLMHALGRRKKLARPQHNAHTHLKQRKKHSAVTTHRRFLQQLPRSLTPSNCLLKLPCRPSIKPLEASWLCPRSPGLCICIAFYDDSSLQLKAFSSPFKASLSFLNTS